MKITLGEMRRMGARGVIVYCADYRGGHNIAVNADGWPDEIRLSDSTVRLHIPWPARCRDTAGIRTAHDGMSGHGI